MLLTGIIWNKIKTKEQKQKRKQGIVPNCLQFENTRKIYHENLLMKEVVDVENCNVSRAYENLSQKLNSAAKEVCHNKANIPNKRGTLKRNINSTLYQNIE